MTNRQKLALWIAAWCTIVGVASYARDGLVLAGVILGFIVGSLLAPNRWLKRMEMEL